MTKIKYLTFKVFINYDQIISRDLNTFLSLKNCNTGEKILHHHKTNKPELFTHDI